MIVETKRLWMREMCEDDFIDLCEMLCDIEVMYAYEHAFCIEEVRDWLHMQLQRYASDGVGLWAIIRKSDGKMIGQCGITKQKLRTKAVWEIGYLFKKQFWHQGYAIEALKGVKQYAREVMKLKSIYSIIRDKNIASQRVALMIGMQAIDKINKHYYHIDMPHIIYRVDLQKPDIYYHVYIDGEFDAIRLQHKYQQMVISLGALICDEFGKEVSTFYETIHPAGFKQLTRVVQHMTHLSNETILASRKLDAIMQDFEAWLHSYDAHLEHIQFYSFGPDDRRTIVKHCEIEKVELNGLFKEVIDLQKVISPTIEYQGKMLSQTLSLDDIKQVFQCVGAVEHNALNDAQDLQKVHWAYIQQVQKDENKMQAIVERKAQKALASKIKQQKRLHKIMQERFVNCSSSITISFYPEVLEYLRNWEMRDVHFHLHFKSHSMIYQECEYPYDKLQMQMSISTQTKIPSVTLTLHYEEKIINLQYGLDYRNATPIEGIIKRCGKEAITNAKRIYE